MLQGTHGRTTGNDGTTAQTSGGISNVYVVRHGMTLAPHLPSDGKWVCESVRECRVRMQCTSVCPRLTLLFFIIFFSLIILAYRLPLAAYFFTLAFQRCYAERYCAVTPPLVPHINDPVGGGSLESSRVRLHGYGYLDDCIIRHPSILYVYILLPGWSWPCAPRVPLPPPTVPADFAVPPAPRDRGVQSWRWSYGDRATETSGAAVGPAGLHRAHICVCI